MAWRAARSLLVLHEQLRTGSRARPPATSPAAWGLIGDAAHDPTSDHTPHDFPGWGDDIVTAGDFPNRPDLGLDAHAVLDSIRRSHDPRVKYGISNGQMFSSYTSSAGIPAWTWRPYTGSSDKHFTHGHMSVVGDARADGQQPWATGIGGDDDMNQEQADQLNYVYRALRTLDGGTALGEVYLRLTGGEPGSPDNKKLPYNLRSLAAAAADDKVRDTALAAAVQALAVGAGIDGPGLLAQIEERINAAVAPLRQQLADAHDENADLRKRLADALGS